MPQPCGQTQPDVAGVNPSSKEGEDEEGESSFCDEGGRCWGRGGWGRAGGGTAAGDEPKAPKLWTLEGELKVHPKFLYRYYLVLLGTGQICALYGADHGREQDQLARLKLPIGVKVRGVLGTEYHDGGTKDNPSAFPAGLTLYMDVREVEPLKIDFSPKPQPGSKR